MKLSITKLPHLKDTNNLLKNLSELGGLCALESASNLNENGRWSIICAAPSKTIESPFSQINAQQIKELSSLPESDNKTLPFTGGVIGHVQYGSNQTSTGSPLIIYSLYTWAFIIDHKNEETVLAYWQGPSQINKDKLIHLSTARPGSAPEFKILINTKPEWSQKKYKSKIEAIHNYIRNGDTYQINLTQRFTGKYSGSSLQAYLKLKAQSSSPFLTYFEHGNLAVASASPELFLSIKDNNVLSKPIKGTVQRSSDKNQDDENIKWLENSSKDQAENLMITDLIRNDMSINCTQVSVPKLFEIESFETVHHLVTTIIGTKKTEVHPFKVFKDAFPGGSITGAPKKRSMEIISELEEGGRGFYCGSTFYHSCNGHFNSNILIRTFEFENGIMTCWAGGGITIESTWKSEYKESLDKISRLIKAIES